MESSQSQIKVETENARNQWTKLGTRVCQIVDQMVSLATTGSTELQEDVAIEYKQQVYEALQDFDAIITCQFHFICYVDRSNPLLFYIVDLNKIKESIDSYHAIEADNYKDLIDSEESQAELIPPPIQSIVPD